MKKLWTRIIWFLITNCNLVEILNFCRFWKKDRLDAVFANGGVKWIEYSHEKPSLWHSQVAQQATENIKTAFSAQNDNLLIAEKIEKLEPVEKSKFSQTMEFHDIHNFRKKPLSIEFDPNDKDDLEVSKQNVRNIENWLKSNDFREKQENHWKEFFARNPQFSQTAK